MKQTEQQYAEALIEKYKEVTKYGHWDDCIKCAIIDVTNTIEALTKFIHIHYVAEEYDYYQTVLTILKEKI
jgi:hypothetical protein